MNLSILSKTGRVMASRRTLVKGVTQNGFRASSSMTGSSFQRRLDGVSYTPTVGKTLSMGVSSTSNIPSTNHAVRAFSTDGSTPFILADIGEGIAEVELLQWFVKEGDEVSQFDPICEVQSDKATVEITSRYDGKITNLGFKVGDMIKVGSPLLHLNGDGSGEASTAPSTPASESPSTPPPAAPAAAPSATPAPVAAGGAPAPTPFLLADIGEGIAEVELLQWFVEEGDQVAQFDRICEVQSDKATVEITSRYDGKITSLEYKVGEMVKVGNPLLFLLDENASTDAAPAATLHSAEHTDDQLQIPTIGAQYHLANDTPAASVGTQAANPNAKILTSPAIRKLAREHNLDLSTIIGTGPKGRVLKGDVLTVLKERGLSSSTPSAPVQAAAPSAAAPAAPAAAAATPVVKSEPATTVTSVDQVDLPLEQDTTLELRGYNRLMVKSMTNSLQIPHMVYSDEIEVTALRKEWKGILPFFPFFIKAASVALKKFPLLNAAYHTEEDDTSLTLLAEHNIGVAMDTPRGLIVPVIKNVERKTVQQVADELNRLKEMAREGTVPPEDLQGASFTISNIGAVGGGGTYMGPIISSPQVAIGALGQLQRVPRFVSEDSMEIREALVMNVSWAGDHRVVDGATMARFHTQWKNYLQDPTLLLTEMA